MMCKRLIILASVVLLVLLGSSASAYDYWVGYTSDWTDGTNWGDGTAPTSTDWVDFRSDTWIANYPIITAGQIAVCGEIRMNPGYGPQVPSITVDGGILHAYKEVYIGDQGGDAQFILNSGTVYVGYSGAHNWTLVGGNGGFGELYINGGIFHAGVLGIPKWWEIQPGTGGHVYIDGGILLTRGIVFTDDVPGAIEFTKNFPDGGGILIDIQDMNDVEFANWQSTVQTWIDTGRIFTSASEIAVEYESVENSRTTLIYSIPEPTTVALLGLGSGWFLRRRRRNRK